MKKFELFLFVLVLFLFGSVVADGQTVERTSERPVVEKLLSSLRGGLEWEKRSGAWESRLTDFANMELRSMDLDGTNYMVLSVLFVESGYTYPDLRVGFYAYQVRVHLLFDKKTG